MARLLPLLLSLLLAMLAGPARAIGSVDVIPSGWFYKVEDDTIRHLPYRTSRDTAAREWFAIWRQGVEYDSKKPDAQCWTNVAAEYVDNTKVKLYINTSQNPKGAACGGVGTQVQEKAIKYMTKQSSGCPDNSTGSPTSSPTSCTCDAGFKPNATAKACVADCTADKVVSSGFYDIGKTAGASPKLLVCSGKCEAVFDGESPAGSAMVNGEKHWFAKGDYIGTGNQCSAAKEATDQVGLGAPKIPEDTCKPGEAKGTVNGKKVCVPQSGDGEGKPSKDSENKATKTTSKTIQTNPDGSTTEIETTTEIDSDGNKKVTKTTTTRKPDGSVSTETEITNGGKWPAGRDPDKPDDGKDDGKDEEKSKCEKNSSDEGCGGNPAPVGELYQKKTKTMGSVLEAHAAAFRASGFGAAVSGFFNVQAGGSCPTWATAIPFLKGEAKLDHLCTPLGLDALAALKVCVLLVASFFAFRIAVE